MKKALEYSKRAEDTSNLETDENGCGERKRSRDKPVRYEGSASSDESKLVIVYCMLNGMKQLANTIIANDTCFLLD